ncbi:glycosyltransferase [Lactococcus lactis]|uniref:glycosyltransferase n=1 Tax=Lactococcus lactis TaxID=1358 RepID=UPI0032E4F8CE
MNINNKQKILFISSGFGVGGIERVLSIVANKLSDSYDVDILCLERVKPFYHLDKRIKVIYCSILFSFFYRISRYVHNGLKKYFHVNVRIDFLVKFISYKIDFEVYDSIVFLPYSFFMCPKLMTKSHNSKKIMWMHNNFQVYMNNYYKYMKEDLISTIRYSDKIIALTDEDKKSISTFSNQVVKINNPLTIDSKNNISNLEVKIISITCRYTIQHKGLDYLIKISSYLPPDWKISIAGTGTNKEKKQFMDMIKLAGVESKFIIRGAVRGDELLRHYMHSSIYIMTSRWEGSPLVLTEAMSFGLPIISFENSGALEILQNGKSGVIVEQGNVQEFSKQLNLMINNIDLRKKYAQKSLIRSLDFKMDSIINKWDSILEEQV